MAYTVVSFGKIVLTDRRSWPKTTRRTPCPLSGGRPATACRMGAVSKTPARHDSMFVNSAGRRRARLMIFFLQFLPHTTIFSWLRSPRRDGLARAIPSSRSGRIVVTC
jgi:hypothetical protein